MRATPEQTRQNVAEVIYLAMPVSTSTQLKCISVGSFVRTTGTPAQTFKFTDAPAALAALTSPHPPGKLALVNEH